MPDGYIVANASAQGARKLPQGKGDKMNVPQQTLLDAYLAWLGTSTIGLGNGSIGLITAAFVPGQVATTASITEANYQGYARQALGTPSVTFTGADGTEYIEFNSLRFQPTGNASPNLVYGLFYTYGNSTVNIAQSDAFTPPKSMATTSNQITITPRCGLAPSGNYGLNSVSN